MTVTEWLQNICTLRGEGYQDYTDEAKRALKTAILQALENGYNETDVFGLVHTKEIIPLTFDEYVKISEILTTGEEFIRFLEIRTIQGAKHDTESIVSLVNYNQHQVIELDTSFSNDEPYCYLIKNSSDNSIKFVNIDLVNYGGDPAVVDTIKFTYWAWEDAWITPTTPDTTNVLLNFKQTFIDMMTVNAAKILVKE